jgi:hypothetical protein
MLPDFNDIWHMTVVRLSGSRTGRLYPQEIFIRNIGGTIKTREKPDYSEKKLPHSPFIQYKYHND